MSNDCHSSLHFLALRDLGLDDQEQDNLVAGDGWMVSIPLSLSDGGQDLY